MSSHRGKVVILCGGEGTRIREVSEVVPKPMLAVGNRPILWHIMKIYSHYGYHDFVLLLGYKGHTIREYFLNFAAYTSDVTVNLNCTGEDRFVFHGSPAESWRVTLVDTGDKALTGARVWRARKYFADDEYFCLTYGDGLTDLNLTTLIGFHRSHGKLATVTGVHPPGRFGELNVQGSSVRSFSEKPQVTGGFINGGFFVFNKKVLERYFSDREDLMLEAEPLENMAKDGELMMYSHDGFWQAMDTPREFRYLNDQWQAGTAPWKVWR